MNTILYIDTSLTDTTKVAIETEGKRYEEVSVSKQYRSQMVLPLIEKILASHTLKLTDITAIEVVTASGSFTGLRVGAAIANALGQLLDVPVNGKKALVNPTY